jgi:Abortive infection alpha
MTMTVDPKTSVELAKAVAETTKNVPVYQDALQPLMKQVGKSLGTIGGLINVALAPVALMIHGYEVMQKQLESKLEEKLTGIDPARIVRPPLPVVGPLIDRYRFVHNNPELADMFENLLANAMDIATVKRAHPAFVQIISELSSEEAKLVKTIASEPILPKLDVSARAIDLKNTPGLSAVLKNFTLLDEKAGVSGELIYSYLSNLMRLGILNNRPGAIYTNQSCYEPLMKHETLVSLGRMVASHQMELVFEKGIIEITAFGNLFMEAVLQKIPSGPEKQQTLAYP